MGRRKNDGVVRSHMVSSALNDEEYEMLNYCCERDESTRADVVRWAIKKYYYECKEENERV